MFVKVIKKINLYDNSLKGQLQVPLTVISLYPIYKYNCKSEEVLYNNHLIIISLEKL